MSVVVSLIWLVSWSMAVVWTVAISCWPRHLRTRSSPLASGAYLNVRLSSRGNGETMVAVRDFSGLAICAWALARAAANAPMLALDCCMVSLQIKKIETDRARFRSLGTHPVPRGLPGILRHKCLELGLGPVVIERGGAGQPVEVGELRPRIGAAHIDGSNGFD